MPDVFAYVKAFKRALADGLQKFPEVAAAAAFFAMIVLATRMLRDDRMLALGVLISGTIIAVVALLLGAGRILRQSAEADAKSKREHERRLRAMERPAIQVGGVPAQSAPRSQE